MMVATDVGKRAETAEGFYLDCGPKYSHRKMGCWVLAMVEAVVGENKSDGTSSCDADFCKKTPKTFLT